MKAILPGTGKPRWRIWIDTGGTFTDGVARTPDGASRRVKILSSSALRGTLLERLGPDRFRIRESWSAPAGLIRGFGFRVLDHEHGERFVTEHDPAAGELRLSAPLLDELPPGTAFEVVSPEEAPVLAARLLTGIPGPGPVPRADLRLATTLGTNALLQRAGVPTALFITRGFGDLLHIGNQQRPDLFALEVRRPDPLYADVVEVDERIAANGEVLRPLQLEPLAGRCRELLESGVRVAAVALLHSYRNAEHEQQLRRQLLDWGFDEVSCSAELAPRIKLLPRAQTAVVDAYLSPVVRTYLERVRGDVEGGSLLVMTSAGGLLDPQRFRPKDSLLSGPAGGVVGAALSGRQAGYTRIIGFDMGGTSTDVARYDGDYEYLYEHRVGDAHLVAPALAIESVAAGGGSICWLDGERLRVGPQSAGAQPGPACYGAGGPLTLTDVNLLLGRLRPGRFEIPIRVEPARARLDALLSELTRRSGKPAAAEAILEGLLIIANETMADAIRTISLRRGYDPADYALVAFGGAGGQHACGVAEQLGMRRIVVPPDAALLSALGLGRAVVERFAERQVLQPLQRCDAQIGDWFDELAEEAIAGVAEVGLSRDDIEVRRRILHLRFAGQDATLEVEWAPDVPVLGAFRRRYVELYGHQPENRAVELESLRAVASSRSEAESVESAQPEDLPATPQRNVPAVFDGKRREVPAYEREQLLPGAGLDGPALVLERHSATVVEPGWRLRVDALGALILDRAAAAAGADTAQPEAVRLELFTQRFHTLVREMGERLERTAVSTNVKERLDFSCALLDPGGELVVNAPHIPVHLGALGLCVRRLKQAVSMEDGDVVVTNHPLFGGSHLPDVTVVTAVHDPDDPSRPLGYLASRAHHAEIGGSRPGSVPPSATKLGEEGVVIPPMYVIRKGREGWSDLRRVLETGPYPSRSVDDNIADLRAAAAANHAGAMALRQLAAEHGAGTLLHYMRELKRLAEQKIREALSAIPDGTYEGLERLDDGTPLRVRIELSGDSARIDFTGSGDVHPGNLNATPAIVQSAVIYVLRLLLREPLPLNEGLLRAVTIELPRGLLNPDFPEDPMQAPAVVGGNVETSQRLVDTLLKALGLAACSQGTMNNVIFGNRHYGYYETLGGGGGAGDGFHGASGLHSHMTNTRITDPEVMEHRYPVRVERFALRGGSGGAGRFRGGDGLVREIAFLEPASVSVLTQHRVERPYGLHGGSDGEVGRQQIVRVGGATERLSSVDGCEVAAGDRLIVETPGGGGYGEPD